MGSCLSYTYKTTIETSQIGHYAINQFINPPTGKDQMLNSMYLSLYIKCYHIWRIGKVTRLLPQTDFILPICYLFNLIYLNFMNLVIMIETNSRAEYNRMSANILCIYWFNHFLAISCKGLCICKYFSMFCQDIYSPKPCIQTDYYKRTSMTIYPVCLAQIQYKLICF